MAVSWKLGNDLLREGGKGEKGRGEKRGEREKKVEVFHSFPMLYLVFSHVFHVF